ncbi:alpha/beta hydrolase [Anaerolineae bacterium CFX9]|nr:alpha/beta hydrolase [Anaerolineae bacterium CFX9]
MSEIHTARGSFWAADQRRSGDARPILLLIHGAGGSRLDWSAEMRRLPNVQCVLPDLASHGRSAAPIRQTIEEHTADMLALCDALEIEQALIAGHSMGGAIALQMALDAPNRVRGLILIGTGAHLPVNPALLEALQFSPETGKLKIMRWSAAPGTPEAMVEQVNQTLRETPGEVLYAAFAAVSRFDVRDRLAAITAPSLIVCGSRDVMTPPALSEELLERLPHARLVMIEGGGHQVINEQPAEAASAVKSWIDEVIAT